MGGRLSRIVSARLRSPPSPAARASPASSPGSPSSTSPPVSSARKSPEEWARLLNEMSGVIQSRPWGGTSGMGASAGEGKTTGEHVARRTKATMDKLPRRREERGAEGDGQGEEGRRGRGRLLMEEMLEVFRVRREQGREGLKGLSEKLQVEERDLEELARFTRGILGRRDPDGVVRGYSDPAHSVERFEDEEDTRPEKQARGA